MSENKPDDLPPSSDAPVSPAEEAVSEPMADAVGSDDNTAKPAMEKSVTAAPHRSTRKGGAGFLWLLVLLLLAAVGYLGWQHWLQQSQPTVIDQDIGQFEGRLDDVQQELRDLQRHMEGRLAGVNEQGEVRARELRERLMRQEGRINDMARSDHDDRILAEIDYLLRLASQRLVVDRDSEVAVGLLTSADELLRDLDDSELYTLREAIVNDLAALRSIRKVDRTGLYLRLAALQQGIAELPLERYEPDLGQTQIRNGTTSPGRETWWQKSRDTLSVVWSHLDDYIRIYRRDEPLQPLLSPDEESYLRLNLNLMLEQAQVALLRAQPEIYQASLAKAASWVQSYFVDDGRRAVILQDIEDLQSAEVVQSTADLAASLQAMREVLSARPLEAGSSSRASNP